MSCIWVGDESKRPNTWIESWKQNHPKWKHTILGNDYVFGRKWKNQRIIDYYKEQGRWEGVADVVRYEYLYENGGFMHPADSICLEPIDEIFDNNYTAYAVYENEIVRPGLISPLYACEKGDVFAKDIINELLKVKEFDMPWKTTGNLLMQKMAERGYPKLKILPSHTFTPIHYTGQRYKGNGKIYATQMWGTTNSLTKLSAGLIAYNEEEMITEALESIKDVDELVVVIDSRTNDKTEEIARRYTDKIYYFDWVDDFAKAKNFVLSKMTNEWKMVIDADWDVKVPISEIKSAIRQSNADQIDLKLYPRGMEWKTHLLPCIFKGNVQYKGMAHEYAVGGKRDPKDYNLLTEYDRSPNHAKDPDRYIRILTKQIKEDNDPRWKFYLAREHYYKKDFKKATEILKDYFPKSTFLAERAEAYLMASKCYWYLQQGDKAREMCMNAIIINPNFKNALNFMSQIVWKKHSKAWQDYAKLADDSEVLFR